MKKQLGDRARVMHILEAIGHINAYTEKVAFSDFEQNDMMVFACIKQLEIIGEAANHLSDSTKDSFPEISWKEIIGLRHVLVHQYYEVNVQLIWGIVSNDLPTFKTQIENIYQNL